MMSEDLIWEVLIHLPTKSLMRFKCVSKLWYSIIRSPKFAIARGCIGGGCFRGLLIGDIYFHPYRRYVSQLLFHLNINDGPKLIQHQFTMHEPEQYSKFTPVVKGLIGMYDEGGNNFTLCNIATHELLKLPPSPSPSPSPLEDSYCEFYYHVVFDDVEEFFKVLSVCRRFDDEDDTIDQTTHVFTLGINNSDMNWRNVAAPTPLNLFINYQFLCINGVCYWLPYEEGWYRPTLKAFHLNSETFESIAIPEFTWPKGFAELGEICGRLALVGIDIQSSMLDVWTMNNDKIGDKLEPWTRKRVVLPTSFWYEASLNYDASLNYVATLPTGQMILSYHESESLPLRIYIYDHLKNQFDSIIVEEELEEYESHGSGMFSEQSGMRFLEMKICYYEENIIPLASFMSN